MEAGFVAGAAAASMSGRGVRSRVLCRNFSRGACRWGQNCRFSHDRKSSQICRHFQNGFCCYGDRCNYQHVPPLPGGAFGSRRSSEPAVCLPPASFLSSRHASYSSLSRMPLLPASGLDGARCGSEPTLPSVMELRRDFEQLNTEFEEDEPSISVGFAGGPPTDWALAAEFIPRRTLLEDSVLRESGLKRSASNPSMQEKVSDELLGHQECKPITACPKTPQEQLVVSRKDADSASFEQSKEVVCGICMDKVYEKAHPHERLFGILPKCNHPYCVGCIRKWRKSRDFESEVIKACPQCRIKSSYFIPHKYWISDAAEKEKLVQMFTNRTSKIRCRFFVRGGHCPFKSDCIYLHELPAGWQPTRRRSTAVTSYRFVDLDDEDDEDDDDFEDFYLLHCAVALAILEQASSLDYTQEIEIMLGCSDSD